MRFRAALFDFDGTLVDSFAGITASTNHVRQHFGLPPMTEDEIRIYVGLGLPNLMETVVPDSPLEESIAVYRAHHPSVMISGTRLLPGVRDTLEALHNRGVLMAICSNKAVVFTRELASALGIDAWFATILGPEDVGGRPKPDPAMLIEAIQRFGVTRDETVYVGDMAVDVHAGKAAGLVVWLVQGGATGRESAVDAGPDKILQRFEELRELLTPPDAVSD